MLSKHLIIVRHGEAESPNALQKDFDRRLNTTGFGDASRMGKQLLSKQLNNHPIRLGAVYSSPANRAITTARLLGEQLGFEYEHIIQEPDMYETSVRKLMLLINGLDEQQHTVMLVGHNPHLSYLIEMLTQEEVGSLPTCGVAAITFEAQTWSAISGATGKLVWFAYPDPINNQR
jgi:phosphohistidine phosphatase